MSADAYRPLTNAERAVLDYLITDAVADSATLRAQAAVARARPSCTCGCPSIGFQIDASRAPRAEGMLGDVPTVVAETETMSGPAHPGLVVLFVKDGWLFDLELADMRGDNPSAAFPSVATLAPPLPGPSGR